MQGSHPRPASARPWRIRAPRAFLVSTLLVGVTAAAANVLLYQEVGRLAARGAGDALRTSLWTLAALLAARALLTLSARLLGARISVRVRRDTRRALFAAVCERGPDAVRARGVGSLHELLTDRVEALDPYFALYLPQLVIGLVAPLAILAMLAVADPVTALALLAVVPVVPLLLATVQRRFRIVGARYAEAAAELSAVVLHGIRSLGTLTVFGRVASYERKLRRDAASLRAQTVRLLAANQLALLVVELFFSLVVVLVATVLGVTRHSAGALPMELALAMPLIAIELTRPINLVGAFFFAGALGRQAKREIEAYVAEPRGVTTERPVAPAPSAGADGPATGAVGAVGRAANGRAANGSAADRPRATGAAPARAAGTERVDGAPTGLRIDDVSFAYPTVPGRAVLRGFSLHVRPGEIVALTGASGSGKSTIAKLVAGLYRPDAGRILADGVALETLDGGARARRVSYLPQRPYVFAMTLRDNVRLAVPDATDDDVLRALEAAGLGRRLASLGLGTPIGEDAAGLSGGERVRLSLARALVAGARYLVLDEPTAEVDSLAEAGILAHLRGLGGSAGVLLIAHRRSTIESCDRVVWLGEGRASLPPPAPEQSLHA